MRVNNCVPKESVANGSDDLRAKLDLYNEKAFEAGHRHDDQAWRKYTKAAKQIADQLGLKYKVTGYGLEILEQGVAEGVNDYLWHGSREEHDVLYPRQANDTGGKKESNKNAVYATPNAKVAIAMGLTTPGSDTGMFPNDPQMVLFKGNIRKGQMVYLHKVPKDLFIKHNSREWYSKPGVEEVKPIEVVKVPVDKYLNLIRQATPQDLELRKKYMKQGVAEGSGRALVYISKNKVLEFEQWMESEGLETEVPKKDVGKFIVYDYSGQDVTTKSYADDWNEKPEQGVAEGSEQINWIKPNFDFEWHEVEEQSKMKQVPIEVRQYYQKHFPNKEAWLKSVQNGRVVTINPDHNFEIRNAPYDKESLMQVLAPTSHEGPIGPAKQKRVNALFDKGGPIEMPIILKTSNGLWLIGGKTRLGTANYIKGIPAKVWMIGGEQGVAEGRKR